MVSDLPHSPHLISPANRLVSPSCRGRWRDFQLVLHDGKTLAVNQRFVPFLHHDPVLRLLLANGADFEAVILLLGSYRPGINGIHQDVLYHGEIPHIPPVFRVFLLPFGANIAEAPFPVPPCRARHLLFFQPAPDEVGAVSFQRPKEDLPDNGGGFLVHQQVVFVLRVFPIPKGSHTAGKLALLGFQKIRGMYLLGNILAVHLVQDVLKRRNVVVVPHGVDTVIHGDIADAVTGEEVLDQCAGLQVVSANRYTYKSFVITRFICLRSMAFNIRFRSGRSIFSPV